MRATIVQQLCNNDQFTFFCFWNRATVEPQCSVSVCFESRRRNLTRWHDCGKIKKKQKMNMVARLWHDLKKKKENEHGGTIVARFNQKEETEHGGTIVARFQKRIMVA